MKQYQIVVSHNKKLWCTVNINVPWYKDVLQDMSARFSQEHGYRIEILESNKIHQVIEYRGDDMRVLMREPIFENK